ncbi:VOC family protein [Paenibacillus sp. NEAU-GSW1]|uniref:VOC family protein n=1 Tax=Paenibacillus sp. NEAU-GSW1 TaxID=2682486 RepID=UPI0020A69542|nr:VOC family protein [Paenibacillus sp. NEAU-GSW1]
MLRTFYKNMGWTETDWSSDNYSVFKTAGGMLSIWSIHEMTKDVTIPVSDTPDYFRGVTLSINVDAPSQVDEVIEKAKEAGAKILTDAHDAFWGGRSGSFFDPENNYWEIAYNPNSVFDERGAMIEMNG